MTWITKEIANIFNWIGQNLKSISIKELAIFMGALVTIQTARNKIKFDLATKQIELCNNFLRDFYHLRKIHPQKILERICYEYSALKNERKYSHVKQEIFSTDHTDLIQIRDKLGDIGFDHFTPEAYDYLIAYLQEYDKLLKFTAQLRDNSNLDNIDIEKIRTSAAQLNNSIYPRTYKIAEGLEKKKDEYMNMLEELTQSIFESYTNKARKFLRIRKNRKKLKKELNNFLDDIKKTKDF